MGRDAFPGITSFASTMIMPNDQTPAPPPAEPKKDNRRRWRFQYSLRTLLIAVTVVGVLSGWVGIIMKRVYYQRQVVAKIQALDWQVAYDYEIRGEKTENGERLPPGPSLVRWMLGNDAFAYVEVVWTLNKHAKDQDLLLLLALPELKEVSLDGPGITDDGLKTLIDIPNINGLALNDTSVTGEGLEYLKNAKKLERLSLWGATVNDSTLKQLYTIDNLHHLQVIRTPVTDDGMFFLSRITQLRGLDLYQNGAITDISLIGQLKNLETVDIRGNTALNKGFSQLKQLPNLKQLRIGSAPFDDSDIEILDNLKELTFLDLGGTHITDAGLVHLQELKNLKSLNLSETKVTDEGIKQLKPLTNLEFLELYSTNVTNAGLGNFACFTKLKYLEVGPNIDKAHLLELKKLKPDCIFILIDSQGIMEDITSERP
jgi:hypothetical protein